MRGNPWFLLADAGKYLCDKEANQYGAQCESLIVVQFIAILSIDLQIFSHICQTQARQGTFKVSAIKFYACQCYFDIVLSYGDTPKMMNQNGSGHRHMPYTNILVLDYRCT